MFIFDEKQREAVESVAELCRKKGIKGYIVGGAVRDAFLKVRPRDIDMCFEEDPRSLINELDPESFVYHDAFSTAAVTFRNGTEIDFIRCRKEKYERDGALPSVTPSGIEDDLRRRDFTVNALAFDVVSEKVIDLFGGVGDIAAGRIRSVHGNSFREDPTRIFRAVKYSARYGFEIEQADEIKKCISEGAFATISSERYFNEVYSLCAESSWEKAVRCCGRLGILNLDAERLFIRNIFADYSQTDVRLLNLAWALKDSLAIARLADNSAAGKELKGALKGFLNDRFASRTAEARDNYDIYLALKESGVYDRVLLGFDSSLTYKLIGYERIMDVKLAIDGEYVRKAGAAEGREIGRILQHVLMLKLNLGLDLEKKYFDENLGEILDVTKHKA
jgi:tRNA nucleotidyltransferase (CCA-adding enzyme)